MAVTSDIVESWRRPRRVIRRLVRARPGEPFAFSLLVAFLVLAFVAQWPVAARATVLQPEVPLAQRLLAAGMALLASIPFWYALAAMSRLAARLLGGRGSYGSARLALFMALLAVSPLMLFQGLASGFLGSGPSVAATGVAVFAGFAYLWGAMLVEAETGAAEGT